MKQQTYTGYFDGKKIILDNEIKLKKDTKVIVTVLEENEEKELRSLSSLSIGKAYSNDEPDYNDNLIKEPNPYYKNE